MSKIPEGFCQCGCGQETRISLRTDRRCGHIKDQPIKYIFNHDKRRKGNLAIGWKGGRFITKDGYVKVHCVDHHRAINGYALEHILICEKSLGKKLPPNAVIHHINEDKTNNKPTNLIICESSHYHELLHQRMRALKICGHANWRSCKFCKQYDAPCNLHINKNQAYHNSCAAEYQHIKRQLSALE